MHCTAEMHDLASRIACRVGMDLCVGGETRILEVGHCTSKIDGAVVGTSHCDLMDPGVRRVARRILEMEICAFH